MMTRHSKEIPQGSLPPVDPAVEEYYGCPYPWITTIRVIYQKIGRLDKASARSVEYCCLLLPAPKHKREPLNFFLLSLLGGLVGAQFARHEMGFTNNWSDTRQSSKNGFVATVHAHGIVATNGKLSNGRTCVLIDL